jgi:hypothetical protein
VYCPIFSRAPKTVKASGIGTSPRSKKHEHRVFSKVFQSQKRRQSEVGFQGDLFHIDGSAHPQPAELKTPKQTLMATYAALADDRRGMDADGDGDCCRYLVLCEATCGGQSAVNSSNAPCALSCSCRVVCYVFFLFLRVCVC